MTPEQRAAMEARHVERDGTCLACWERAAGPPNQSNMVTYLRPHAWPCDARQALDALVEVEADAAARSHGGLLLYTQQRDARIAEAALARRLARMLDEAVNQYHANGLVSDHRGIPVQDGPVPFAECEDMTCRESRAALIAYRERHGEGGT